MARARGLDELIAGRLIEHGAAPYQFRKGEQPSYFLKLQTDRGVRVLWGKDLPRALAFSETHAKVGDMVGAKRVGREQVTIIEKQRDADGRVVSQREQEAHRTQWVVEKVQFFTERARAARRLREERMDADSAVKIGPEVTRRSFSIEAAEKFAQERIQHPEDRERFMEMLRAAAAASLEEPGSAYPKHAQSRESRTR